MSDGRVPAGDIAAFLDRNKGPVSTVDLAGVLGMSASSLSRRLRRRSFEPEEEAAAWNLSAALDSAERFAESPGEWLARFDERIGSRPLDLDTGLLRATAKIFEHVACPTGGRLIVVDRFAEFTRKAFRSAFDLAERGGIRCVRLELGSISSGEELMDSFLSQLPKGRGAERGKGFYQLLDRLDRSAARWPICVVLDQVDGIPNAYSEFCRIRSVTQMHTRIHYVFVARSVRFSREAVGPTGPFYKQAICVEVRRPRTLNPAFPRA